MPPSVVFAAIHPPPDRVGKPRRSPYKRATPVTNPVAAATGKGKQMLKSRMVVALVALGLMAGGTGGVLAATKSPSTGGASSSQYKPGVGPCKSDGVNPSGTHTGAPGNGQNCDNKPGNSGGNGNGNGNGNNGNGNGNNKGNGNK